MPDRMRWAVPLRTPLGLSGLIGVLLLLAVAIVAPLALHSAANDFNVADAQQNASAAHWFGTDALGRDVFAQTLVATRLSLELALAATVIGAVIGVLAGALPVVLGRRLGRLVVAGIDFTVAFPGLLLALFLIVIFGVGSFGAVLAVGIAIAPFLARLTYTLTAGISGRDFIAASRMLGVGRATLLTRHVLPNVAAPILLNITITISTSLQAFAALSFLGVGVQAPSFDWGLLLNQGLGNLYVNPAQALGPAIAIILAGVTFSSLGEALTRSGDARVGRGDARRSSEPVRSPEPSGAGTGEPVLRVVNLRVGLRGPAGWIEPVRGVSFEIAAGESVGIVGESGSGKSLTAMATGALLPPGMRATADQLEFAGRDLRQLSKPERRFLGTSLSIVFQDPMTTLNPSMRIGRQLAEVLEVHTDTTRKNAMARAVNRLAAVRIPAAARRARQFSHELSGGMRQRAVIGMGLMGSPQLIIADEPTTALDVTVQRQVLDLLEQVRTEEGAAIMLISHDMGVIAQRCQRVLVMYGGRIVEELPAGTLRESATHPYTRALLASIPELTTRPGQVLATIPGQPPDPAAMPPGCPFANRCERADDHCRAQMPPLESLADPSAGRVACWHPYQENHMETV